MEDYHGDYDLPQIVEDSSDYADKYNVSFTEDTEQDSHGAEAENAAAQAVGEGYHLPGYQAGDEDTHHQTEESIFRGGVKQQPERDDICQPQFDAWNRSQSGQQGFYGENGKCYGGVHS
ncbi:hypothetical protein AALA00_04245 [Lachnospiraceae bacterium 46-15]